MNWPYLARNIAGIVLLIVIIGGLFFISLASVMSPNRARKWNYGFGPEWSCIRQLKGDPVCIRRP
jgi:hypothetical protein